ncbi:MAG: hypothetical protein SAK29_16855 [Scytonema sp. PMC 1069.18]|nr:hypothetical protein [Scytonema sp. PMC 1069.18]MEC4880541.1 hypothetical protein [Scytonema sp. PMC 1070.18]
MTRQPHDQFAKQYLEELLSPYGLVEVTREVIDEVRFVDVLFAPAASPSTELQNLGLLGRIAKKDCLLEPFRNQPSKTELRNCMLKLFSICGELQRKARRENTPLPEDDLPHLWILTTSASLNLLNSFGATLQLDDWLPGVYFLAESLKTAVVAINQLPTIPQTLLLRILGKGETQRQAIAELLALPETNQLRQNVQELVANWRVRIELQPPFTQEDQELLMNLSPIYLERLEASRQQGQQEGRQQGRQEGRQEGQRLVLENLLKVKFGAVDEELSSVIDALLELPPEEFAQLLLQLSSLSREDLLARFGNSYN